MGNPVYASIKVLAAGDTLSLYRQTIHLLGRKTSAHMF
jgi:hypothetical protein